MDEQTKKRFENLVGELIPENLHADGEISPAQAMRKYRRLKAEWQQLETRVGRKVTEDEVWGWIIKESDAKAKRDSNQ